MFCISGFSGTGKDEIANRLTSRHDAIQTGLADPAKRHLADLYGFTEEQLFGQSRFRNKGDIRYPKNGISQLREYGFAEVNQPVGICGTLKRDVMYWSYEGRGGKDVSDLPYVPLELGNARFYIPECDPRVWLSPREALQQYCEKMNEMYLRSWSKKGIEIHKKLTQSYSKTSEDTLFHFQYSKMQGIIPNTVWKKNTEEVITCFSDFRHKHEILEANEAEAESLTPILIRVKRPSVPTPPYQHRSETEQTEISDSEFDYVVNNNGSLDDLYCKVDSIVSETKNPEWANIRIVRKILES